MVLYFMWSLFEFKLVSPVVSFEMQVYFFEEVDVFNESFDSQYFLRVQLLIEVVGNCQYLMFKI